MSTKLVKYKEPVPDLWKWTPKREKALRLYLKGMFVKDIAVEVHMTRATVHNWIKAPEWQGRILTELEGRGMSGGMKQNYFGSKVAHELMDRYLHVLGKYKAAQLSPIKSLKRRIGQRSYLEELQILGKELDRARNQQRLDGGQATSVSKHTSVMLHTGKVEHQHDHQHTLDFRDYMDKHRNVITVNPAASSQQQLLDATVQVMQESTYLEDLMAKEQEAAAATTGSKAGK